MTETPKLVIETPVQGRRVPGPDGTDVLSAVLRLFRASGAALLTGEFTEPWAWEASPASELAALLQLRSTRIVIFHIVAEGECWVETDRTPRAVLRAGDVVGFPHGDAHRMGAGERVRPIPVASLYPPPPWNGLPAVRHGGDGTLSRIVCVYLRCDELLFSPLLASLPAALIVRPSGEAAAHWIEATVRYIVAEAQNGQPGGADMIARLTELLFIEILRMHMARLGEHDTGWLAALGDPHVGRALQAFHSRPAHPWTAGELAREVGLSRSALVERFHRRLETSPMRYLALWRVQLAMQALESSDAPLAAIAAEAGYGSEEAFSRAFKRLTGTSPATWRRQRRDGASH